MDTLFPIPEARTVPLSALAKFAHDHGYPFDPALTTVAEITVGQGRGPGSEVPA